MKISLQSSGLSLLSLSSNMSVMLKSAQRLSSGLRINQASDDPAGLVVSEQLRSQIASLNQEIENISSNINKYQTVSSSVSGLREQLVELRTLAIGAANEGGNSPASQEAFDKAAQQIVTSYNNTVDNAEYNGSQTLDGSEGSLANVSELMNIDLSTAAAAEASIEHLDAAVAELDTVQVEIGSTQANSFESQLRSLEVTRENLTAAESQLRDADFAGEFTNFVSSQIRTQVSLAMLAHAMMNGSSVVSLLNT
jgi:flagellin